MGSRGSGCAHPDLKSTCPFRGNRRSRNLKSEKVAQNKIRERKTRAKLLRCEHFWFPCWEPAPSGRTGAASDFIVLLMREFVVVQDMEGAGRTGADANGHSNVNTKTHCGAGICRGTVDLLFWMIAHARYLHGHYVTDPL